MIQSAALLGAVVALTWTLTRAFTESMREWRAERESLRNRRIICDRYGEPAQ